jgi:hypothetical protein
MWLFSRPAFSLLSGSRLENRDHAACKQRKIAMWREMGQATNHCQ